MVLFYVLIVCTVTLSVATEKKSPVTPPGIDPETVRLVAQCLNHYATLGPHYIGIAERNIERSRILDLSGSVYSGLL